MYDNIKALPSFIILWTACRGSLLPLNHVWSVRSTWLLPSLTIRNVLVVCTMHACSESLLTLLNSDSKLVKVKFHLIFC